MRVLLKLALSLDAASHPTHQVRCRMLCPGGISLRHLHKEVTAHVSHNSAVG